jgi:hypothetical protein
MLDRNKILEDIKTNQFNFFKSSNEIRELVLNDLEICFELFKNYPIILLLNFKEVSQDIRDNKDFVIKYLSLYGDDLDLISDRLKSDIDVCLVSALSTNGTSLKCVDKSLYNNVLFLKLSLKTVKFDIINSPREYFDILEKIYKNSDLFRDTIIRLEILFKYHRLLKALILVLITTSSLFFSYKVFLKLYNVSSLSDGDMLLLIFIEGIGWVIPFMLFYFLNFILFGFIPWKIISRKIKFKFVEQYNN